MRLLILFALSTFFIKYGLSQTAITEQYPKTLWSANDSFTIRFSNAANYPSSYQISKRDTFDNGTDAVVGIFATLSFGNDSLKFDYKNLPFAQVHFIRFQSAKGSCVFRLHFNETRAAFARTYIETNKRKVQVQIPEVFELANVVWILSPIGRRTIKMSQQDTYYNRVIRYFKPYLNHPIFRELSFDDAVATKYYYDFRDNSLAFSFENNRIVYKGPYYYITGNDKDFNSLFKQLLPLINDFSQKSNFRNFYNQNKSYYNRLIDRQKQLMPVSTMWAWLEQQFPNRYEAYKVVFSPLITVSHSTQNFFNFVDGSYFSETVMFVSGSNFYDTTANASEYLRQGIASGIVFTEIDHNYVNPVSSKYRNLIDSIFSNRKYWTNAGGDTKFYETPEMVFNEYMTHAVFCLYALDKYDFTTANYIIKKREALMVEHRHYIKFKEFNKELISLRTHYKDLKVADLFPKIIDWCKTQM